MGGFQRASGFISFPFSSWGAHPTTPIQGKSYQVLTGPEGKASCYSSQHLKSLSSIHCAQPAAWASIAIRWFLWTPPPGPPGQQWAQAMVWPTESSVHLLKGLLLNKIAPATRPL
jgi:hypothetical protein